MRNSPRPSPPKAYHKPAKPPVPLKLAPWEHATLPHPLPLGLLPAKHAGPLFLMLAGLGMVLLNPTLGPWGIPVALVLARLLVLDVAAYVLPDVYTLPLLATGVVATALAQQWCAHRFHSPLVRHPAPA